MGGQVMRRVWPRPSFEAGRRTEDRHAEVRPDAHGDHVLRHLLAQAHARIIALGHDVGQTIVADDLDLDIRVVRQEPARAGARIVSAACSPT